MHDADENGVGGEGPAHLVGVQEAGGVHRQHDDLEALGLKEAGRGQHRGMFGGRGDDPSPPKFGGHAFEDGVVGFGGAAGEDDVLRGGVKQAATWRRAWAAASRAVSPRA